VFLHSCHFLSTSVYDTVLSSLRFPCTVPTKKLFQDELIPGCTGDIFGYRSILLQSSVCHTLCLLFAIRYCQVSSLVHVVISAVVISSRCSVLLIDNFLMYAVLRQAEISVLFCWLGDAVS